MALLHRAFLASALVVAALALPRASTAGLAIPGAPGVQIIPADEVMERFTEYDGTGALLFREKDGAVVRMITSTDDPEVSNPGEGRFFAADVDELERALMEIPSEFMRELNVDIYVLPFPRAGQLASSAGNGVIYISPGVRPLEPHHVHFLLAHEIGHAVHRHFMPDSDSSSWARFAELRGIADSSTYSESSVHANRPHEIFAEDFRVLFGGDLAAGDGSIENNRIQPPDSVPGLVEFFHRMVAGEPMLAANSPRLAPNPAFPGGTITILGAADPIRVGEAALLDAMGRKVASMGARASSGLDLTFELPRRTERGAALPAGAYWVRWTDDRGQGIVLPLRVLR